MSDRDLRNLYENVRRGDEYHAPRRESELYGDVLKHEPLNEEVVLNFKHPDTGKKVSQRVSDEYVRKYLLPDLEYKGESLSYINKLIEHGIHAGIFNDGVNADAKEVRVFWNWITESIPREENMLRTFFTSQGLYNPALADMFVDKIQQGSRFNMFNIASQALQSIGWEGITFNINDSIVKIRPMSDANATRGAAGPGEALMAFLFSGSKPEVGDLAIQWSGMSDRPFIVELKYKGGRIGKGINQASMNKLAKNEGLFHNLQTTHAQSGQVKDVDKLIKTYNNSFVSMLDDLSGVSPIPGWAVADISQVTIEAFLSQSGTLHGLYGNNPYMKLSQYIGAAHAKDYANKIAAFDALSVFDDSGDIGSIQFKTITSGTLHQIVTEVANAGCIFKPKLDKEGFQIMLKELEKVENDENLELKIDTQ